MIHTYDVKQDGNIVKLRLWREAELITTIDVVWCKLNYWFAVKNNIGTPKAIEKQFEIAHARGKEHVAILNKYETV